MTTQNDNERPDTIETVEEAESAASMETGTETAQAIEATASVQEPEVPEASEALELEPEPESSNEQEADSFYEYLTSEYRRFRLLTWVLGGCGFALILVSVGLSQAGIVTFGVYNVMMSVAYFFILLMAIIIFTRTRPFKRKMKEFKGEPLSQLHDDDAPDGVRMEEGNFRDMDDIYKILERDIRTEVVPDLPEYRRLRRTWLAVFIAAAALGAVSLLLYYLFPSLNVVASLMLLAAFALVVIAFYLDRTRMKPMRNDWARRYGMTEMQMRDNLREIRKGERDMIE